jgi:hypothetical protein
MMRSEGRATYTRLAARKNEKGIGRKPAWMLVVNFTFVTSTFNYALFTCKNTLHNESGGIKLCN